MIKCMPGVPDPVFGKPDNPVMAEKNPVELNLDSWKQIVSRPMVWRMLIARNSSTIVTISKYLYRRIPGIFASEIRSVEYSMIILPEVIRRYQRFRCHGHQ